MSMTRSAASEAKGGVEADGFDALLLILGILLFNLDPV